MVRDPELARPPARVSALLARAAPAGVLFRRGPSKWTLVLGWNTDTDEVEPGDWFRGHIYEHRCDVSPDGTHLAYFAATHGGGGLPDCDYGYSWTGVSESPSLRPVGYWSQGHSWYGGGLFKDDSHLWVNRPVDEASLYAMADDQEIRRRFTVTFNEQAHGEDEPIFGMRRSRDGWEARQEPVVETSNDGWATWAPEIREKSGPNGVSLRWTRALNKYTWDTVFEVVAASGTTTIDGAHWADWDQRGRLVFSRDGVLCEGELRDGAVVSRAIADLNDFQPD